MWAPLKAATAVGIVAAHFATRRGCFAFSPSHLGRCNLSLLSSHADDRSGPSPRDTISPLVPRVSLEDFLASPVYDKPTLIKDIVSSDQVETIAEELMARLGDADVQMQRKIRSAGSGGDDITEIYDITLLQAAEYMMESCHDDSFFAFCEGLLDEKSDDGDSNALSSRLGMIREAPFDGSKIWRFIIPPTTTRNDEEGGGVGEVDDALESYRLDSIAWTTTDTTNSKEMAADEEEKRDALILSRGWQSDLHLYFSRAEEVLSALELSELEEDNMEAYVMEIEAMGADTSLLVPDERISDFLRNHKLNFSTAIQQAGDLLIIPSHWWHQTYAPVPSMAIASQRCGAVVDGLSVVQHIFESLSNTTNTFSDGSPLEISEILKKSSYEEGEGENVVNALVQLISSLS
ncbi:MAG: hypothetical protein SGARI_001724 [Bacillariaceae sp.]